MFQGYHYESYKFSQAFYVWIFFIVKNIHTQIIGIKSYSKTHRKKLFGWKSVTSVSSWPSHFLFTFYTSNPPICMMKWWFIKSTRNNYIYLVATVYNFNHLLSISNCKCWEKNEYFFFFWWEKNEYFFYW